MIFNKCVFRNDTSTDIVMTTEFRHNSTIPVGDTTVNHSYTSAGINIRGTIELHYKGRIYDHIASWVNDRHGTLDHNVWMIVANEHDHLCLVHDAGMDMLTAILGLHIYTIPVFTNVVLATYVRDEDTTYTVRIRTSIFGAGYMFKYGEIYPKVFGELLSVSTKSDDGKYAQYKYVSGAMYVHDDTKVTITKRDKLLVIQHSGTVTDIIYEQVGDAIESEFDVATDRESDV
jgi:hypothetical protein